MPQIQTEAPAAVPPAICALCGHGGRGDVAQHHLTHGVTVWLCGPHRSPGYLRRRRGRTFTDRLEANWRANGTATRRRIAALHTHRRRITHPATARPAPGSYAWPNLRKEAERRFAGGEPPGRVIRDLRSEHADGPATAPSVRTMRRWFTQGRWLATPRTSATNRSIRTRGRRRQLRDVLPQLPAGFNQDPLWPFSRLPLPDP